MKTTTYCTSLLGISALMLISASSEAVPNFARQVDKKCSYCHSAWPQLNQKGRQFKELGYRLPNASTNLKFNDFLEENAFPISAAIKARPYDKKDTGDNNARILHEIELFIAGRFNNKWSGFLEIEAEDDHTDTATDGDGFEVEMAGAWMTYNYDKTLNVSLAWAPVLFNDGYGLLNDGFKLTRNRAAVIDGTKFGGADGGGKTFRDNRQVLSLSGRLTNQLFYTAGLSGEPDDYEGGDASNIHARIAYDITPNIMVGALTMSGKTRGDTATPLAEVGFTRSGIDFQGDFGNTRIQAAFITADDEQQAGGVVTGEDSNDAWTVVAMHTFRDPTGKPTWVPTLRLDNWQSGNGANEFESTTLSISYYLQENARAFVEFYSKSDADPTKDYDRTTIQVDVGF